MSYYKKTKEAYESLTPGLKKVAESLLTNPILFAIHPAKKIAEVLEVSETMVIRFSKAIGYDGFGTLQLEVKRNLLAIGAPDRTTLENEQHPYSHIMESDSKNILHTAEQLEWEIVEQIVDCIAKAITLKVIGYYHSFSYAHWFSVMLNSVVGNSTLYRPETDIGIIHEGTEHCVIIFSYYRYALETIRLAEEAKSNGNQVIVITDSQLSPVVKFADYTLLIPIVQRSILEKGPVTFSVLNSILLQLAKKLGKLDLINPTNNYYIR